MRKLMLTAVAAWLVLSPLASRFWAADTKTGKPAPALRVGDTAPDFKLQYFDGKELQDVSLSQYHGKKNVILAFYIFAFTGG